MLFFNLMQYVKNEYDTNKKFKDALRFWTLDLPFINASPTYQAINSYTFNIIRSTSIFYQNIGEN